MSITPTPAGNPEDLSTAVRQWVHFDNVAENLNKQIANVRALRAEYEAKVLELLANKNLRHATLRVTGATLQYATKSKSTDLSWTFLEEQLHEYFRTKGTADQTAEILTFLHRHRGGKTIEYLKKTPLAQSTTTSTTGNHR
jgi:cation transport regulator ChaC